MYVYGQHCSKRIGRGRAWRGWAALLGAVACSITFAASPVPAQTTIAQKIAVPAYFLPELGGWKQLNESTPAVGLAVANVLNGPDYMAKDNYKTAIREAHDRGIKVLGYVDTSFFSLNERRPDEPPKMTRLNQTGVEAWRSQIQHDIDDWYAFYGASGLDGIFFDQALNECTGKGHDYAQLYRSVSDYVKQNHPGAVTVINPGSPVPQCYQDSADILLTFENRYACYAGTSDCDSNQHYVPLDWNPVDPKKVWHLIYSTNELQLPDAIARSKQRSAGYVYATPLGTPNPWDALPTGSYWSTHQTAIAPGGTPDTTAPTVPTALKKASVGPTSIGLEWGQSTDAGSGLAAYDVFRDGNQIWSVPGGGAMPTHTDAGLTPTSSHVFAVRARDLAGNLSANSASLNASTAAASGSPPTAPGRPAVSELGYTSAQLAWAASSDADDTVTAYDLYRGADKIMTVPGNVTSATVIALKPDTTTSFTVKARDSKGNVSAASNAASVTTSPLPGGKAIANPTGSYTATNVTYSADFLMPFAFRRVFIDSDNNASTGFLTTGIGADHVIDGGKLMRYDGKGGDWVWKDVRLVEPTITSYTFTWKILTGDLGTNPATTQKVFFQAEGASPYAFSDVMTLTRQ